MITKDQLIDRLNKKLIKVEKERDAQIGIALDALEKIRSRNNCAHEHGNTNCTFHDAQWAIEKMRAIHEASKA